MTCTKNCANEHQLSLGLQYALVIWAIYLSGVVTVAYKNFWLLLIGTCLLIALVLFQSKVMILKRQEMRFYVGFLLLMLVTVVQLFISAFLSHIFYGSVKMVFVFFFCFLICKKMDFLFFTQKFTDVIFFFAIISLALYWFNSAIVQSHIFPIFYTDSVTYYVNLYVYCINPAIIHRNCGIFWEPGTFQIFLNLSLLFTLTDEKVKWKKLKVIVLILTILTTISTAGYFVMALILLCYLLQSSWKKKMKILCLVCLALLVVSGYLLPIVTQSFEYKFGLNGNELSDNVTSRINPFLLDLRLISDNPFGLKGVDYYAELLSDYSIQYSLPYISSSCTLTMAAAVYGIIPGVMLLWGMFLFGKIFYTKRLLFFLLYIALLIMFSTESFLIFPLYYLICFWGLKGGNSHDLLRGKFLPSGRSI